MTEHPPPEFRHVERCMGTVFSITVRTAGVGPAAIGSVCDWLHWVDRTFSTYRLDSEVNRVERGELALDDASPELVEILDLAHDLELGTSGYFSARFDGRLDPSGVVKGWAIGRASDVLRAAGSENHCVNGGGDVQCLAPADAPPWRIGVVDPFDSTRLSTVVTGTTIAVATSGNAERGRHIIDPHTGTAADHFASLTLVGQDITLLDAHATAAFAMGEGARAWIEDRGDYEALAVTATGQRWNAGRTRGLLIDGRSAAPRFGTAVLSG